MLLLIDADKMLCNEMKKIQENLKISPYEERRESGTICLMPKGIKGCSSDSQQRQNSAGGGCRPPGAAPGCECQKNSRQWKPGRSLGRHSLLRGLDCRREKPFTLWGPKSLLFEGEDLCSKEAFPLGFAREIGMDWS